MIQNPVIGKKLPTLTNPAGAEHIQSGYEAIDGDGNPVTGTLLVQNEIVTGIFELSSENVNRYSFILPATIGKENLVIVWDSSTYPSGTVICAYVYNGTGRVSNNASTSTGFTFDNTTGQVTSTWTFGANIVYRYFTW